ncbi:TonB-dependent receptor [Allosphingosinicella flava]|uniref:TonB-dependent receptor n=1 Tax=Allosphingosinicella flava TaxID=2771430 RepID=A0A7T2GM45_9SPHN|nr:TonB-dependent receptor [Sphingosinicella flava]QPQ56058.1 TonB-dependent receptor [Sphingosinicella flava]
MISRAAMEEAYYWGGAAKFAIANAQFHLFGVEYRYERDAQFRITTTGPVLPPHIERRRFLGQEWAQEKGQSRLAGVTVEKGIGKEWQLGAGGFFSQNHPEKAFLQIFSSADANGNARSVILASPQQRFTAWSGEMKLGWHRQQGTFDHRISAYLRGRRSSARFGGDALLNLGMVNLFDEQVQTDPLTLSAQSRDTDVVDQIGAGLTYRFAWADRLLTSLSLFKTQYRKVFTRSGSPAEETTADPWLYNGMAIIPLTPSLSIYGSYTRGLEEAGVAPQTAVNRNAVLPPIHVRQRKWGFAMLCRPMRRWSSRGSISTSLMPAFAAIRTSMI